MKVLMISKAYPPWIGGVENVVYNMAEGIKDKVDLTVMVANNKPKTQIDESMGFKLIRLKSFGTKASTPMALGFPFAMRKMEWDIIHFHFPYPLAELSYLLFTKRSGKMVVSYHADIFRQKRLVKIYKPFMMRFLSKAERIITSSKNLIDGSRYLESFEDKCRVIPFGINLKMFEFTEKMNEKVTAIKNQWGDNIILFVGRIVDYKGLPFLVKAIEGVDAKLLIVGDGPLRRSLKAQCKTMKMDDKVIFIGDVSDEDLPAYYHACRIFVFPSLEGEAFGISQVEAQACGKPVISTNIPSGVPFVNLDGVTGVVVGPASSNQLRDAILKLLGDESLRKELGEAARRRATEEFSREKMAKSILNLYLEVLEG